MSKIIVLGGGAAGLAFSAYMLSHKHHELILVEADDVLGGKASSRQVKGKTVEHGIHFVYGFYRNFLQLMDMAGIPRKELLRFDRETHMYEPSLNLVHGDPFRPYQEKLVSKTKHFYKALNFLSIVDKLRVLGSFALTNAVALLGEYAMVVDRLDSSQFFALAGMSRKGRKMSFISRLFEPFGNRPFSAYHLLSLMKAINGRGFETGGGHGYLLRSGYSERIWEPVGCFLVENGAKILRHTSVKKLIANTDTGRIVIQLSDGQQLTCCTEQGDILVSALPAPVIEHLLIDHNDKPMRVTGTPKENLSSLTLMLYTRKRVPYRHMSNLPAPFHDYTDMKPFWDEVKTNPEIGSLLYFNGFEDEESERDDQALIEKVLNDIAQTAIGDLRSYDIVDIVFHRNNTATSQLACFQPGEQKQRQPLPIMKNLHLIGDWTNREFPLPCMESAIGSGFLLAKNLIANNKNFTKV